MQYLLHADIAFIMSNSTFAWLLSPLECSPQKQNGWTLRFCFWGWIMWKMYNKTIIEFRFCMISWIIKTSCLCYLPKPSASADNTGQSVLIIHDTGSGRVFSGSGIWPKYVAGIGKTINILTGTGIWLLVKSNRENVRKAREPYLIERGQTLEPHGLNKKDET